MSFRTDDFLLCCTKFLPALVGIIEQLAVTFGHVLDGRRRITRKSLSRERIDPFARVLIDGELSGQFFGARGKFIFRQRGESKPWRKDRIVLLAPLFQAADPMLHHTRIQLVFSRQTFGLRFIGQALRFVSRQKIITGALPKL